MAHGFWSFYEDMCASLYEWNLQRWQGSALNASVATAFGLSLTMVMWCSLLLIATNVLWGPRHGMGQRWLAYGLVAGCFFTNCAWFLYRRRYQYLMTNFQAKSSPRQRLAAIAAWTYVISGPMLLLGLLLVMARVSGQL